MSDTGDQASTSVQSGDTQEKKAKNPKAKPPHPPTSEIVTDAIKGLKERGGSSLQTIKKYVAVNYKVDADKVAPFIEKYLKSAVQNGTLVQTKGKGASGFFKLSSASASGGKQSAASDKKKSAGAAKARKPASNKAGAGEEKSKFTLKKATKAKKEKASGAKAKKTAASGEKKSPSKAKKSKAGTIKKPKTPKPKSAKAVQSKRASKKPASSKKK